MNHDGVLRPCSRIPETTIGIIIQQPGQAPASPGSQQHQALPVTRPTAPDDDLKMVAGSALMFGFDDAV